MDSLTEKLYKKYKFCRVCGKKYGSDRKREIHESHCPTCGRMAGKVKHD